MSDSSHVTDILPDLLHQTLDAGTRAAVESHLSECESCRRELEVLRRARGALSAPPVDTARVAAAIPPYVAVRRRWLSGVAWRIAAAILVVAGALVLWRTAGPPARQLADRQLAEPPRVEAPAPASPRDPVTARSEVKVAAQTPVVRPAELATGETLHDLSEADLRALLQEISALDGVTSSETEVVVPAVGKGSQ